MPTVRVIAITVIWLLGSWMGIAAADQPALVWNTTRLPLDTPFGAAEIQSTFYYTNHGLLPVTIDQVTSTCSCTTGYGAGDVCIPGQTRAIHVIISTADLLGAQDRVVSVTYHAGDDRGHPFAIGLHTLTNIVSTDACASWDRRFLHWDVGSPPVPQVCTFTVHQEPPIHLTTCLVLGEGFTAALHEQTRGQIYSVTITPADTAGKHWAHVMLTSDAALPILQHCEIIALVMPPLTPKVP